MPLTVTVADADTVTEAVTVGVVVSDALTVEVTVPVADRVVVRLPVVVVVTVRVTVRDVVPLADAVSVTVGDSDTESDKEGESVGVGVSDDEGAGDDCSNRWWLAGPAGRTPTDHGTEGGDGTPNPMEAGPDAAATAAASVQVATTTASCDTPSAGGHGQPCRQALIRKCMRSAEGARDSGCGAGEGWVNRRTVGQPGNVPG